MLVSNPYEIKELMVSQLVYNVEMHLLARERFYNDPNKLSIAESLNDANTSSQSTIPGFGFSDQPNDQEIYIMMKQTTRAWRTYNRRRTRPKLTTNYQSPLQFHSKLLQHSAPPHPRHRHRRSYPDTDLNLDPGEDLHNDDVDDEALVDDCKRMMRYILEVVLSRRQADLTVLDMLGWV